MPTAPMQALCLRCSKPSDAVYETRGTGVHLVRTCAYCGLTDAMVSRDVAFFGRIVDSARAAMPGARGLIAELLDGCNIECPTCIAGSGILAGNVRDADAVQTRISQLAAEQDLPAVLLSGGEPTIHPDFLRLTSFMASLKVPARVLITNGLRFATEPGFLRDFVTAGGAELEVFLQFDSLRPSALLDIRGADYSRERMNAIGGLAEFGVSVTLVNVVKRAVTLAHISEVLEVARQMPNVVGVQFQPIRDAGRVLRFSWTDNSCDIADIFDELPGQVRLTPCPSSPWSTFLGIMDRQSGAIRPDTQGGYYISATNTTSPSDIRIAVLDYSDRYNWTTERSRLAALSILSPSGATPSVDDYFLDL